MLKLLLIQTMLIIGLGYVVPFAAANQGSVIQPQYLYNLHVIYGHSAGVEPSDSVKEYNGGNTDINYSMGGQYVWLVPEWTSNPSEAVSWISFMTNGEEVPGLSDIAKGAGGMFRFLIAHKDSVTSPGRDLIYQLTLYRTRSWQHFNPATIGYKHCTSDINAWRGGDYLYLCWK